MFRMLASIRNMARHTVIGWTTYSHTSLGVRIN